jgi:hypothetical protein
MRKFLNRAFLTDLADRTLSTYLQAFLGLELSDVTNLTSLGSTKAAALAALPAALAVLKAAIKGAAGAQEHQGA